MNTHGQNTTARSVTLISNPSPGRVESTFALNVFTKQKLKNGIKIMKKLYGLKDEGGKDVVLNIESVYGRKTATAFDIVEIKTVEKEPEFKVGQWVWQLHAKWVEKSHRKAKLFRINHITNGLLYSDEGLPYKPQYSVLATPQEIEAHLKEICDEKYVGKKVNGLVGEWSGEIRHFSESDFTYQPYDPSVDRFWMKNTENIWVCVYDAGKFAEILPSKKKLPKTKEEFKDFLMDWRLSGHNDEKFLNQYED